MIDGTILSVIPPLIATIFTYIMANKRAKLQHAKLFAQVQSEAIEQIRLAEEKMRIEIWHELDKVRKENADLKHDLDSQKQEIMDLKNQLEASNKVRRELTKQVHDLKALVETYKNRIQELEKRGKD